jgi:hypothetical protein
LLLGYAGSQGIPDHPLVFCSNPCAASYLTNQRIKSLSGRSALTAQHQEKIDDTGIGAGPHN